MLGGLTAQSLVTQLCFELRERIVFLFNDFSGAEIYWEARINNRDWGYFSKAEKEDGGLLYQRIHVFTTKKREKMWIVSSSIEKGRVMSAGGMGDLLVAPLPSVTPAVVDRKLIHGLIPKIIRRAENFKYSFLVYHEDGRLAVHRDSKFMAPLLYFLDQKALQRALKEKSPEPSSSKLIYPEIAPSFVICREPYKISYKKDLAPFLADIIAKILEGEHPYAVSF